MLIWMSDTEVYPDWPLTVESCRWKCLKDQFCSLALPIVLLPLTLWGENAAGQCSLWCFTQLLCLTCSQVLSCSRCSDLLILRVVHGPFAGEHGQFDEWDVFSLVNKHCGICNQLYIWLDCSNSSAIATRYSLKWPLHTSFVGSWWLLRPPHPL